MTAWPTRDQTIIEMQLVEKLRDDGIAEVKQATRDKLKTLRKDAKAKLADLRALLKCT